VRSQTKEISLNREKVNRWNHRLAGKITGTAKDIKSRSSAGQHFFGIGTLGSLFFRVDGLSPD